MLRTFVIGCPRSGTTLVQAMLTRHPDVFSLPETYFFDALLGDTELRWRDREARPTRRWYHRAGMAQSWGRRHLRELEGANLAARRRQPIPRRWRPCVKRYAAMLDAATHGSGHLHWVEKTPTHLLYLPEIEEAIPDARFVHILRNGLDMVASVVDADMRVETGGFRGGAAQWARRWNRAMELHKTRLGKPRHHLVCLEDLIEDAAGEWEHMRAFLGLDPDKPMLPRPGCNIADAKAEYWKDGAITGIVRNVQDKAPAVFGPRSLAWLRQYLTDYREIRRAVRKQHGAATAVSARLMDFKSRQGKWARS